MSRHSMPGAEQMVGDACGRLSKGAQMHCLVLSRNTTSCSIAQH